MEGLGGLVGRSLELGPAIDLSDGKILQASYKVQDYIFDPRYWSYRFRHDEEVLYEWFETVGWSQSR